MEQCKQKAEQIYRSMNSYANPKQMNGIDKDWIVECIARGLQEAATQSPSTTQGAVWLKGMPVVAGTYHVNYKSTLKGTTFFDPNSDTSVKYWEREVESYLDETGSQRQAGMVWVKATQVLPTFGQQLFVKFNGSKYLAETYDEAPNDQVPKISFFFDGRHHFEDEYHLIEYLIEYLNESTPSKEDAVAFATFLFKYCRRVSYNTLTDVCHYVYNDSLYTTEQLYNLYQQNK